MTWGHFTYGTNEENINHYPKRLVLGINVILHVICLKNVWRIQVRLVDNSEHYCL